MCRGLEMGKKDHTEKERVEAVLELLRKQAPLTMKQVCMFMSFTVSDDCWYCFLVSVASADTFTFLFFVFEKES